MNILKKLLSVIISLLMVINPLKISADYMLAPAGARESYLSAIVWKRIKDIKKTPAELHAEAFMGQEKKFLWRDLFRIKLVEAERRILDEEIDFFLSKIVLLENDDIVRKRIKRISKYIFPGTFFGFLTVMFSLPGLMYILFSMLFMSASGFYSYYNETYETCTLSQFLIISLGMPVCLAVSLWVLFIVFKSNTEGLHNKIFKRIWINNDAEQAQADYRYALDHEIAHALLPGDISSNSTTDAFAVLRMMEKEGLLDDNYVGAYKWIKEKKALFEKGKNIVNNIDKIYEWDKAVIIEAYRSWKVVLEKLQNPESVEIPDNIEDIFRKNYTIGLLESPFSRFYGSILAGVAYGLCLNYGLPFDAACRFISYAARVDSIEEAFKKTKADFDNNPNLNEELIYRSY